MIFKNDEKLIKKFMKILLKNFIEKLMKMIKSD